MRLRILLSVSTLLLVLFMNAESGMDAERWLDYEIRTVTVCDSLKVECTWYTSSVYECDETPWITSDGSRVRHGIIALSHDLFDIFSYGDSIYVEGLGWYEIHDLMHDRWNNTVDIWCDNRLYALENGRQKKWIFWNFREETQYFVK